MKYGHTSTPTLPHLELESSCVPFFPHPWPPWVASTLPSDAAIAAGAVAEEDVCTETPPPPPPVDAPTVTARPQVSSEEMALTFTVAGPVDGFGRELPREGKLSPFPI